MHPPAEDAAGGAGAMAGGEGPAAGGGRCPGAGRGWGLAQVARGRGRWEMIRGARAPLSEQRTRIVPCTVGDGKKERGIFRSERARPAEEESEKKKL